MFECSSFAADASKTGDDLLPYAGSVANRFGIDCAEGAGGGKIVATGAGKQDSHGKRWVVRQEVFRADGSSLLLESSRSSRYRLPFERFSARFPELESAIAFPTCAAVRAAQR